MKAHIGVDAETGVVHTLVTTSANVSDVTQAHALLHGEERFGVGDAGYQGAEKREEKPGAPDSMGNRHASGQAQGLAGYAGWTTARAHRTGQGQHPGQVEHPFRIIKNLFGPMKKVSYRGLAEEHSTAVHALWAGESVDWQVLERSQRQKMRAEETK